MVSNQICVLQKSWRCLIRRTSLRIASSGAAGRKMIQSAKFVAVEPGQSIEDVIKQHYKVKNPKALKGLKEATLYLNDTSRYGATPSVIALPSLRHLGHLLGRMRDEVVAVEGRRSTVDEVAILPPLPPTRVAGCVIFSPRTKRALQYSVEVDVTKQSGTTTWETSRFMSIERLFGRRSKPGRGRISASRHHGDGGANQ